MNPLHANRNTWRVPLLPALAILMLIAGSSAVAKTAEDYLHGASYHYVAGKIQEASVEAEEGLRLHPRDARLQTLAEHLRKMKDQQRGNSGQGQGNQDKEQPQDDKQDQKPNEGKDRNRDGENGDRQGDRPDEKNGEPPQDDEPGDGDRDGDRPPQPRKMSEEEAKRLLNSFADEEMKEQAERRKVIRSRAGTEQDW